MAGQFALSYPAATDRAYDPIDPFWQVAPFLGLLGVLLFPLFDDDRRTRRIVRAVYSVGASLSLGWVRSNAMSPVPHSSNLLLAALLALLIVIPVYLVVWLIEKGAASVWARWREFAEDTPGKQRRLPIRFSLAALLVIGFLVALVCGTARWYLTRPATPGEVRWASRSHIRQILWAMRAYHDLHGSFPYSEQDADHAMYQLRDLVDVSVFDAAPRKKFTERACWDDVEKRVRNCDFDYPNQPGFQPAGSSNRVIIMAKPSADPRFTCFAFLCLADGTATRHQFSAPPNSSVLGNWLWVEADAPNWLGHELLFTEAQVFRDWVRTHGPSGGASYSISQDGKITRVGVGGNTIDYKYEQGRLIRFTISTSRGQIEETITTDQLGRIIAITRQPDNWQSLLQDD
jgi:hypothetical protein